MIKHIFVFEPPDMILLDRWYFRTHSKECLRFFRPWLRRYDTYRSCETPPEADAFGVRRGRLTELWYDSVEDFIECHPSERPFTPIDPPTTPPKAPLKPTAVTLVPAMPTEDFLGKEPSPAAGPFLRWDQVIRYPRGVSLAEGEKWYLDTHSPEAARQPGLLKHTSHRALDNPPIETPFHRVTEMWYANFDAWRTAVIDSPPNYTPPPWAGEAPFVRMASTFVPDEPDVDFLRDDPIAP